jgi:glucose/arabinose dehydrogenase
MTSCALNSQEFTGTLRSEREDFIVTPVIRGLSYPWGMAFLPNEGGYLVTQRTGTLLLIREGKSVPVSGTPRVAAIGQGGLLDLALSPYFVSDGLVYMSYAEEESGLYGTSVARGRLVIPAAGGKTRLENLTVIYRALPKSNAQVHFGSRLAFDDDGYLYVTLGERGFMDQAQDTSTPYGSVLRLNPDGTIPVNNPFAPGGSSPGAGKPEIWSYGHRNAQGLVANPATGDMWLHEHGPKGGDEVNIIRPGANYGWPIVTYGTNYDGSSISGQVTAPGVENPVVYWVPSIAPSGMAFYQGNSFPGWKTSLFVGALAGQHLRRLELTGGRVTGQEVLLKGFGRIRDVRTGPDGFVYLLTDAPDGGLFRLSPAK